ncbi:MAG: hypothetical protein ACOC0N_12110 [Chroococcales cyanobacterium]
MSHWGTQTDWARVPFPLTSHHWKKDMKSGNFRKILVTVISGLTLATIQVPIAIASEGLLMATSLDSSSLMNTNTDPNFSRSVLIASTPPKAEIDRWTDDFFYSLHPEMRGRKIQPHQTFYMRDWNIIRRFVSRHLVWTDISCVSDGSQFAWFPDTLMASDLTDALFYARHPELNGRPIRRGETALAEEWNAIHSIFGIGVC